MTERTWLLRLVCCGREDGIERFETWQQADSFRWSYTDAPGHDRAAILTKLPGKLARIHAIRESRLPALATPEGKARG